MRMQTKSSTCGYSGLNSQVGYLFERQRAAMRQNAFARARTVVAKRKTRDDDSTDSDDQLQPPANKKKLLEGLKRMRVSSPPPTIHSSSSNASATRTTDSRYTAMDVAMNGDDEEELTANAQALVSVSRPRRVNARGFSTQWSPSGLYSGVSSDLAMPQTDPSCRAIVLFDATGAIPRGPSPRIELVESDDEQRRSDSEEETPFVRFEEIHDDEDEPMEID